SRDRSFGVGWTNFFADGGVACDVVGVVVIVPRFSPGASSSEHADARHHHAFPRPDWPVTLVTPSGARVVAGSQLQGNGRFRQRLSKCVGTPVWWRGHAVTRRA